VRSAFYEPRGAALALWKSRAPEILIEGPAGTGKTRGVLQKIVALGDRYARSRHLLCRKTRASMTQSVLVTLEEKVLPAGHPTLRGPGREHRQSYVLPNGSELVIGGLDHPERTFSTEYDTITYFEAIEGTEHEWESLHRSLRNGRMGWHQAIADTNPGAPSHWLNQRANLERMQRLFSRHEDNPELHDAAAGKWTPHGAEYIGRLDRLTGVRRLRLRLGIWAAAEGMVYEGWDPAVHLIVPFRIPADWRRWRGVDFGFTNPFVCGWWAQDPDGRLYRYREIYKTGRTVRDHAREIKRLTAAECIEATVADHDAEDRATMRQEGIEAVPAYKAISPGIQAVEQRLERAADGKPRLFVFRDACVERDEALSAAGKPTCAAEEFESYVWPKSTSGKPVKEVPVKENDHGMDETRYVVCHVDKVGKVAAKPSPGSVSLVSLR
jgi:phage terminase large subunit